jgi:hypothetical protein
MHPLFRTVTFGVRLCSWGLRLSAAIAIALGLAAIGHAQNRAQFETWKEQPAERATKGACRDLRALTSYDFSVDAATLVPAQGGVPEFCRVQGQILSEVRFEVSLPSAWNGRLYMFGNGGFAGELFTTPVRIQRRDGALKRGFAVAATNTGHDNTREPQATFAVHPQKLIDFAYRAVHVTAITAKTIVRAYYDGPPARSYFDGCSTGGRQGLIAAQRFPDDFDGIVVGAPILDYSGTSMYRAKINQALAAAPLPPDKVKLVAERVYQKCDALDGLADGLIDDPRRCPFDPAIDLPICASGVNDPACLTAGELKALQAVYGGVVSNGIKIFPGLPVGAEVLAPTSSGPRSGWDPEIVREGQQPRSLERAESVLKYMVTPGTPIDWRTFDPDRDLEKLNTIGTLLNATDPNLSRFHARGGKIIMYFGWADPVLNPLMGVGYYEQVRKTIGPGTGDFVRLFMMPGVFHCAGGVGPDLADTITPLVDWVERGIPPERIFATRKLGEKVVRTRPLCPYPQVAKYKGTGSIDDATNFACANP